MHENQRFNFTVAQLQERLQKPLPEVLAMLIDWATTHSPENFAGLPEPMSLGQWPDLTFSRDSMYGIDGR
jgi:hypothetical protein